MMRLLRQLTTLYTIQIKVFRQIGLIALFISGLLPLCLVFFMKLLMSRFWEGRSDFPDIVLFLLTGNIVLGLSNVCIIMLAQAIANMKEIRSFEYYAVLPINKLTVIISIILSYLTISFPGFILILFLGSFIFRFTFSPHPLILVVMILAAFSFTGVGSLIGTYSRNQIEANLLSQIIGFGLVLLSPVFYPVEILPIPIKILAYIVPTTYSASALRMTIKGNINEGVIFNIIILILMTLASFYFTSKKIKWREV